MDIPTEIPNRINSTVQNYVSKSVIYTFDTKDYIIDNEGNILYKFPYSKNTYWTNFKYSCYKCQEFLDIEIILITHDGYTYNIKESEKQFENKKWYDTEWYDTEWPLPSIYTTGSKEGLYFKMKLPINNNIIFSVLGFIDLYPKVENYILLSPFNTYQFIFYKYEDDILLEKGGSIWNVEHSDYIANIIKKACIIKLMKDY